MFKFMLVFTIQFSAKPIELQPRPPGTIKLLTYSVILDKSVWKLLKLSAHAVCYCRAAPPLHVVPSLATFNNDKNVTANNISWVLKYNVLIVQILHIHHYSKSTPASKSVQHLIILLLGQLLQLKEVPRTHTLLLYLHKHNGVGHNNNDTMIIHKLQELILKSMASRKVVATNFY